MRDLIETLDAAALTPGDQDGAEAKLQGRDQSRTQEFEGGVVFITGAGSGKFLLPHPPFQ